MIPAWRLGSSSLLTASCLGSSLWLTASGLGPTPWLTATLGMISSPLSFSSHEIGHLIERAGLEQLHQRGVNAQVGHLDDQDELRETVGEVIAEVLHEEIRNSRGNREDLPRVLVAWNSVDDEPEQLVDHVLRRNVVVVDSRHPDTFDGRRWPRRDDL